MIVKIMSYAGWFLVELYYMMKRFGKRRIGKVINSLIAFAIFLFGLLLLGQNMIIFSFPSRCHFHFDKNGDFCLIMGVFLNI